MAEPFDHAEQIRLLAQAYAPALVAGMAPQTPLVLAAGAETITPALLAVVASQLATQLMRPVHPTSIKRPVQSLEPVAAALGAHPALLITYGPTLPLAGGLDILARRLARTDVLVAYHDASAASLLDATEPPTYAEAQRLDFLFASRTWRELATPAASAEALRSLYARQLGTLGRWRWSAAMPIRTTWGTHRWTLNFATSDRSAAPAINAALYAAIGWYDDTPDAAANRATAGNPQQISLFDTAPPSAAALLDAKIASVAEAISAIAASEPRLWSLGDLFDRLLRLGWFGRLRWEDFAQACERCAHAGTLERRATTASWQPAALVRLKA